MNTIKSRVIAVVILILAVVGYFYFSSGYGKTSKLGYEFAQSLYSACNQKNLERIKKIEALIDEYSKKNELHRKEKAWLFSIVDLAQSGQWERAQKEARKLLEAQVSQPNGEAREPHQHGTDQHGTDQNEKAH